MARFERRHLLVLVAFLEIFLTAGVLYGWSNLVVAMEAEGQYIELCAANSSIPVNATTECDQRIVRFNLIYSICSSVTAAVFLPGGAFLDRFGPRLSSMLGTFFTLGGAILMAIANTQSRDTIMAGMLLFSCGGPLVYGSAFHLSNLFPGNESMVIAVINGAFDSSSLLFLVFQLIHSSGVPLYMIFFGYCAVPVIMFITGIWLWPPKSFMPANQSADSDSNAEIPSVPLEEEDDITGLQAESGTATPLVKMQPLSGRLSLPSEKPASDNDTDSRRAADDNDITSDAATTCDIGIQESAATAEGATAEGATADVVVLPLSARSIKEQIISREFWLMVYALSILMLQLNYYMGSVGNQLASKTDDEAAAVMFLRVFGVILPACGVASVPVIGRLLDKRGMVFCLVIIVALALLTSVCMVIPSLYFQPVTFVVFSCLRPFVYSAMSSYAAQTFGFVTFGRVWGLAVLISSSVNMLQYAFVAISVTMLQNNFTPVSIGLLVASATLAVFPWYLHRVRRRPQDFAEA
eukprot:TRINITY_DN419_c0_g1_i2.p1 TRINITY_DN419_c0_g1~~TRINITY_DN419_c0_g1_i2.p1  ORF type:complete len:523 (-),score=110.05 TRINITY_DN419_c0_g1_i2:134-1702(-)